MADVLEKCRMQTIAEYICKQRDTIAMYVATRPIFGGVQGGQMAKRVDAKTVVVGTTDEL